MLTQCCTLGRILIKDGIGVIDMDKNLARRRHFIEQLDHAARPGLGHMAHLRSQLVAYLTHTHLVIAPERAIDQQTVGTTHDFQQLRAGLAKSRCVEQRTPALPILDQQTDVVARMWVVAMRRVRRCRTAQRNRSDLQVRASRDDEAALQRDRVPLQATIPVLEHIEQWKAGGQILMDHLGAPDFMGTTFTQGQQASGVVDLAIQQNDRCDGGITRLASRLQLWKGLQLGTDVRRGVTQNPVDAVVADGNGRLGAWLCSQCSGTQTGTVGAVAIPLWKAAASSRTENLDEHGQLPKMKPRPCRGWSISDWRSTW